MYLPCFESSLPPQHPRRWHHNPRLPPLSTAMDPKYLSGPAVTKADFPAVKIILSTTTPNSLQGEVQRFLGHPHPVLPSANAHHITPLFWKAMTASPFHFSHSSPAHLTVVSNLYQHGNPDSHPPRMNALQLKISQDTTTLQCPSSGKMAVAPSCHVGTRCRTSHRASSGMGVADGMLAWYRGWGWGCGVESLLLHAFWCAVEVGGVVVMGSCAFHVMEFDGQNV